MDRHGGASYNRPMQSSQADPSAELGPDTMEPGTVEPDTVEPDTVEIVTFGCRLNAYESEVMRRHARAAGLQKAVVLNSCAVTAEAERQFRQADRKSVV